jgi:hypothetical protein
MFRPMSVRRRLAFVLLAWSAAAPAARAAGQPATATLSATISPQASLTLSTASLVFPDADPDVLNQVPAAGGPVTISAKARATAGQPVVLTVLASGDLRSGLDVIAASNVTWTAAGAGFVAGTLSATVPAPVAIWTGSGLHNGSQQYFFHNLWAHPTGTYTTTLVYTLSAP